MNERDTVFSPCRRYRYSLWREWIGDDGYAMFVGLNPSTADETNDDPTIRRCIAFSRAWGYGAYCMTNLFAWRDTDPAAMKRQAHPIGPDNDDWLRRCAEGAGIVIAAWGTHGSHMGRGAQVASMLPRLHCLKLTKDGHPSHPLYLSASLMPIPYGKCTGAAAPQA